MDRRASFPVFAASRPSAGLARVSHSDRAANHASRRVLRSLRFPTQHLHGGKSPLLIIVRGMEIFSMDTNSEKLALFRYGLIAPLVIERLPRGELTRRAQEIAARTYDIPHSKRTAVSVDTLLDWALRYRNGGFEALAPKPRQDRGQSRVINPQLPAPPAHKKFEAELSNQIWQADMLFGPWVRRVKGGGRMQAFLHATLDDASRLIPHAQFYASQGLDASLDCLRHAVAARGLPARLYIDNAKIYRSPQLARIAASLGILIVHSRPYQPEGRGKVERFFRTVREQFLANLDPKHTLSLEELNDRLWIWIESVYHRSEHSALGGTPLARWQRDSEQVRQLPPATDLRRLFFHRLDRLVRRDSTFLLHKLLYEAPPHLAGHTVEVRFDPLDAAEVEIWFQGKLDVTARPVDPVVNGQLPFVKRAASAEPESTGINFVELLKQKPEKE